jgi:membrane protease YdiL (CAAX protease family)
MAFVPQKTSAAPSHAQAQRWFYFGCAFEMLLLAAAALLAWVFNLPLLADFDWELRDVAWAGGALLPLLVMFAWMLKTRWPALVQIRQFIEREALPILGKWSVWQLGVISLLAGLGEEALFRSVTQGGLSRALGTMPTLLIASAGFGLAHMITRAYAVLAGAVGLYLGSIWLLSGNLLVPILVHALYDFAALIYFCRFHPLSRFQKAVEK